MREIRTSGSEGGGTGNLTGPPYPYIPDLRGSIFQNTLIEIDLLLKVGRASYPSARDGEGTSRMPYRASPVTLTLSSRRRILL